jgi:hypothetical protein
MPLIERFAASIARARGELYSQWKKERNGKRLTELWKRRVCAISPHFILTVDEPGFEALTARCVNAPKIRLTCSIKIKCSGRTGITVILPAALGDQMEKTWLSWLDVIAVRSSQVSQASGQWLARYWLPLVKVMRRGKSKIENRNFWIFSRRLSHLMKLTPYLCFGWTSAICFSNCWVWHLPQSLLLKLLGPILSEGDLVLAKDLCSKIMQAQSATIDWCFPTQLRIESSASEWMRVDRSIWRDGYAAWSPSLWLARSHLYLTET